MCAQNNQILSPRAWTGHPPRAGETGPFPRGLCGAGKRSQDVYQRHRAWQSQHGNRDCSRAGMCLGNETQRTRSQGGVGIASVRGPQLQRAIPTYLEVQSLRLIWPVLLEFFYAI